MDRGYIKLWRKAKDDETFKSDGLWRMWSYCLLSAAHKEHTEVVGLRTINVPAGSFITGRYKLAHELSVKPSTAWRRLNVLKNRGKIDIKSDTKFSLVTVINWPLYQSGDLPADTNRDNDPDIKWTSNGHQMDTNKNSNNRNTNSNNDIHVSDAAERIYQLYPSARRGNKPSTIRDIKKAIAKYGLDFVVERAEAYAAVIAPYAGSKLIPLSSTWWHQERFNDSPESWVTNFKDDEPEVRRLV